MKIGDYEIEVITQPYEGGWMSVAYLPDGKQVASAPWDTQEAAEHDVIEQARMRLLPMPQREPAGTFEAAIAQRRADHLLEHCGHCPGDKPGDVTKARCPACGGPGILQDRDGRVNFRCRDCGAELLREAWRDHVRGRGQALWELRMLRPWLPALPRRVRQPRQDQLASRGHGGQDRDLVLPRLRQRRARLGAVPRRPWSLHPWHHAPQAILAQHVRQADTPTQGFLLP